MCCGSTESAFAWVGAVMINVAFGALIVWGTISSWVTGFVLSALYSAVLLVLALAMDRRGPGGADSGADSGASSGPGGGGENDDGGDDEEEGPQRRLCGLPPPSSPPSVPANIFYCLFALSLGVTGAFLPINLLQCDYWGGGSWGGGGGGGAGGGGGRWVTDLSLLPEGAVREWAAGEDGGGSAAPYVRPATFAHVPEQALTVFSGTDSTGIQGVFAVGGPGRGAGGGKPHRLKGAVRGGNFVVLPGGGGPACLVAEDEDEEDGSGGSWSTYVACVKDGGGPDGTAPALVATDAAGDRIQQPQDLLAGPGGSLWFREVKYDGYESYSLVYSVDVSTMAETLHSVYVGGEEDGEEDGAPLTPVDDCAGRSRAALALFSTALPVAAAGLALWLARGVPSAPLALYVGVSASATFLNAAIWNWESTYTFSRWWYYPSSLAWTAALTVLVHSGAPGGGAPGGGGSASTSSPEVSSPPSPTGPQRWGLAVGSVALLAGSVLLSTVFDYGSYVEGIGTGEGWERWIALNFLALPPLLFLGLANDFASVLPLVLAATVLLMDSFRIASVLFNGTLPVYFIVFAISGLVIAGLGFLISRTQARIHARLAGWLARMSLPCGCLHRSGAEGEHGPTKEGTDAVPRSLGGVVHVEGCDA